MVSRNQLNYINEWQKAKKIRFTALLDKKQDASIIAKLKSVPNKTDYIRQLILKDIGQNH